MLNKVQLIGRLGGDPEVRRLNNGDKVVNFTLATSEKWTDKNSGERKEKTEWSRIVIFNDKIGEIAEKYLRKGLLCYVEGSLQTRQWEKDGAKQYTTEIVLQKFRGDLKLLQFADDEPRQEPRRGGGGETAPARDGLSDEIPFITRWEMS